MEAIKVIGEMALVGGQLGIIFLAVWTFTGICNASNGLASSVYYHKPKKDIIEYVLVILSLALIMVFLVSLFIIINK